MTPLKAISYTGRPTAVYGQLVLIVHLYHDNHVQFSLPPVINITSPKYIKTNNIWNFIIIGLESISNFP